jgi:hypothetical protein
MAPRPKPRRIVKPVGSAARTQGSKVAARAGRRAEIDAASRIVDGLGKRVRAQRLAALSRRAAQKGLAGLDEGAALAGISEGIGALSDAARALSLEEVERGMELAAMGGQIGTVGDAVRAMGMESLGSFLVEMGRRMRDMAANDMLESQDTRGIALAMGDVGAEVAVIGEGEVATAMDELTRAEAAADASVRAEAAGTVEIAGGLAEARPEPGPAKAAPKARRQPKKG